MTAGLRGCRTRGHRAAPAVPRGAGTVTRLRRLVIVPPRGQARLIALAVVLAVAALVGRHLLDRRRLAAWDAAWRATGPKWSHHR